MTFLKAGAFALVLSTTAITAQAQQVGEITASAGVSTFGLNLEGAYQFDPQFRLRGALVGMPGLDVLSDTFEEDGTTYNYDASIGAVALLADYYPTNSGWRVSGGLMFNQTELNANATLTAGNTFTLDDGTIINSGDVEIKSEFAKTIAPMVTTGYDYRFDNNWVLSGEIGAIYTGGVNVTATSTNATLQTQIDGDSDIQRAKSDARDVTFYPYISVTVGYTF